MQPGAVADPEEGEERKELTGTDGVTVPRRGQSLKRGYPDEGLIDQNQDNKVSTGNKTARIGPAQPVTPPHADCQDKDRGTKDTDKEVRAGTAGRQQQPRGCHHRRGCKERRLPRDQRVATEK